MFVVAVTLQRANTQQLNVSVSPGTHCRLLCTPCCCDSTLCSGRLLCNVVLVRVECGKMCQNGDVLQDLCWLWSIWSLFLPSCSHIPQHGRSNRDLLSHNNLGSRFCGPRFPRASLAACKCQPTHHKSRLLVQYLRGCDGSMRDDCIASPLLPSRGEANRFKHGEGKKSC